MEVDRYLARIGVDAAGAPDLEQLERLMRAHLLAVPFENLDIHLGIPVRLDLARFYRKVVLAHRGGGCYELNGLFAHLLRTLGYRVDLLAGRVVRPHKRGHDFDHLALRVTLGDRAYLVDVGFGDGIRRPMELEVGAHERFGERDFILAERDGALCLELTHDGIFDKGIVLSPQPRELSEFEHRRHQHHSDPRHWFARTRIVTLATPTGRRTLMNDHYRVTEGARVIDTEVPRWQYLTVLRRDFGIHLDRVPRTKAEWPSMRLYASALTWRGRLQKLISSRSNVE